MVCGVVNDELHFILFCVLMKDMIIIILQVKYVEGSFDEDYIQTLGSLIFFTFCTDNVGVCLFIYYFFVFYHIFEFYE